ncbi:MAG: hypothetical protein NTV70_07790 [Acidobacteria bacterium]|nr:hypothetical protein [Acidobacteriota bacterium]
MPFHIPDAQRQWVTWVVSVLLALMAFSLLVKWWVWSFALGEYIIGHGGSPWEHTFYWLMPLCAAALWVTMGWLLVRLPNVILAISIVLLPAFLYNLTSDWFLAVSVLYALTLALAGLGVFARSVVIRRRDRARSAPPGPA